MTHNWYLIFLSMKRLLLTTHAKRNKHNGKNQILIARAIIVITLMITQITIVISNWYEWTVLQQKLTTRLWVQLSSSVAGFMNMLQNCDDATLRLVPYVMCPSTMFVCTLVSKIWPATRNSSMLSTCYVRTITR